MRKPSRQSPHKQSETKGVYNAVPSYLQDSRVSSIGNYRQVLGNLMPKGEEFGEVTRLAYTTEADQVVIDEDGLYLLQKYSTASIGFLGIIGQDDLSKKFFLDAGLSLCSCQGNQFTSVYSQQQTEGILLWSLPLIPTSKLKLFLLICTGMPPAFEQLQRRHQILLDLTLLLSSSLVIFNTPHIFAQKSKRIFDREDEPKPKEFDSLPFLIKDLQGANKRICKDNCLLSREDILWPQTAFFLQPFKYPPSVQLQAQELFSRCNFYEIGSPLLKEQTVEELLLSLNEQTLRADPTFLGSVGEVFLSLVGSGTAKEYEGLRLSGNLVCKLLINATKYMAKKQNIKLEKIFFSIFKELYEASYIYHCQNYEELLQSQFLDEQPLSEDALLLTLQSTADNILASFNQHTINSQVHETYERQLLQHIEKKEKLIIEVNIRKNEGKIAGKIKSIQQTTAFEPEFIKKYIDSLKNIVREHDHGPIELIVSKLLKYSNNLEQRIIDQRLRVQKEQIAILRESLRRKYMEYMKCKEVNDEARKSNTERETAYKKGLKELQAVDNKLRSVRKEIEAERKFQKQYIITRESKKEAAEKLLEQIREVEEKVRDYNRQMEDINKDYDYHPDILALHKRIEDKEKQIRQLDKNQSRLHSNIQHSLVRSAIQKLPEGASQLQKSGITNGQKGSELRVPERKTIKRLTASKK